MHSLVRLVANQLTPCSLVFVKPPFSTYSKIPQYFMEPEDSLPCSHEPSTGPYHERYESSPYHPIICLLRLIIMLSSHLRLGLPSCLFPSGFPTKPYTHSCSLPCVWW
jgi:hypothetical protein